MGSQEERKPVMTFQAASDATMSAVHILEGQIEEDNPWVIVPLPEPVQIQAGKHYAAFLDEDGKPTVVQEVCEACLQPIDDCMGHSKIVEETKQWLSSRYDADLMVDD